MNDRFERSPRRETNQSMTAPHSVVAVIGDLEQARELIEELEQRGIPPNAISLIEPDGVAPARRERSSDRQVVGQVGRTVLLGALVGAVCGLAGGFITHLVVSDVPLGPAMALGAVFAALIGGTAGGISVVKYSSPAWRQSQHTVDSDRISVGVQHIDPDVVDSAESVMAGRQPIRLDRRDR